VILLFRAQDTSAGAAASIANSSASGNVTIANGASFSASAGGLVGFNSATGSISNATRPETSAWAPAPCRRLVGQNEA